MSVDHDEPKLRILHVISGLDPRSGGTVAALVGWASALARAGVRVDVASTYNNGADPTFVNSLRAQGLNVHMIGPAIRPLLGWHKDIASTLRPLIAQADVVHIHALWEEIQYRAARLSLAANKPYVISPHGMLDPWSLSQRHLKKTIYMRMRLRKCFDDASAMAYTCQEERNLALPLGIPAPAIVESLGLDLSEFNDLPPRGEFRQRHPALGDRPIVLFLARLHPKKGADLLLRGFAQAFADPATSPALVIAGPDSEGTRAALEQLARDLNVSDRVLFTGMLRGRERIAAMVDADLFALTSHQENFGIAIAEALAAGTPVLISNKVNIYREIEAAAVGGVVTLDVPVIARELHRWMTSTELRQAAAAKARNWALSTCNWDAIAHNWIGHYSKLSGMHNTKSSRARELKTDKPHVLHVISSLDRKAGGPVTALEGLVRAQCQQGLRVSVVSMWARQDTITIASSLANAGASVTTIGPALGRLQWHRSLRPILNRLISEADIVHIHALWEEIQHQAARTARRLAKPYIMRPCGMLDPWSLSQHRFRKRLYLAWRLRRDLNNAAAIHFTADQERDLTAPLVLKAKSIVVPNGIDLDEFQHLPPKGTFHQRHPQMGGRPMVLFLSRIHPKKGLDILVSAFAEVLHTIKNQKSQIKNEWPFLVIAGPDSDNSQADVEQMVREQGIQDDVLFAVPLFGQDKLAAYADATLFVLPSYQENFGIVVVEALAAGCPVVISDQVNIFQEIVAAGVGRATPLEASAFAESISYYLGDETSRQAAASAARQFVQSNYNWQAVSETWRDHYRQIIAACVSQEVR